METLVLPSGQAPPDASCSRRSCIVAIMRPAQNSEPRLPQLSLHTPVGDLTLSEEAGQLVAVDWGWGRDQTATPALLEARRQMQAYFDGDLRHFDLDLAPTGTEYRKRVWRALMDVPLGQTRTYAELAVAAGGSPRSIGTAMARNPLPIIVPCHRVVASNGAGGYSGGEGLPTKYFLLALERRLASPVPTTQPRLDLP